MSHMNHNDSVIAFQAHNSKSARLLKFRVSSAIAVLKKVQPWVQTVRKKQQFQTGHSTCFFGWGKILTKQPAIISTRVRMSCSHDFPCPSFDVTAITPFWWRFCSCFRLHVLSTLSKAIVFDGAFDSWFFAINSCIRVSLGRAQWCKLRVLQTITLNSNDSFAKPSVRSSISSTILVSALASWGFWSSCLSAVICLCITLPLSLP